MSMSMRSKKSETGIEGKSRMYDENPVRTVRQAMRETVDDEGVGSQLRKGYGK